jgi:hypothetical protein
MQGCTREQADNLLMIAMKESNVDAVTRFAVFEAVRGFGDGAWRKNAEERTQGFVRVLPDTSMTFGPNVTWAEFRKTLADNGVSEPAFPPQTDYCRFGDSTEVPGPSR